MHEVPKYLCCSTHNNTSDWLKVGKENKKIGLNSNLTKFGVNLAIPI
jgi:hypothetical protein